MDKWGRKAGVVFCSFWSLLGGALICGSNGTAMFITARFFAGMGSWGFLAVTPAYSAELAPPALRGFFVGLNGVNIAIGYAIAAYTGMGFFYVKEPQAQWRGPLGIALFFPLLMLAMLPFVPESPRYLLMKGREEEAEKIVLRLHAIPGDEDQEFARGEFYQMRKQAEFDRTLSVSWWDMFFKKSYRKRTILAMGFAFVGQSTGVLVINNYGPTLYKSLGYGTEDQLRLQCGWITTAIIGNAIGAVFMDRIGRKPLMLFGVGGCCFWLIIEAAMVASFAGTDNTSGLAMGVAALFLFEVVYSCGVDVAGIVFYSEVFPNHLRAKGVCMSMAVVALTDLVYLQVTATAFANIGWKFYLVFIIICGVGTITMFFLLPETKGVPLEEVAKLFGDTETIMVYASDIHVDHNTHELVVSGRDGTVVHPDSTVETTKGIAAVTEKSDGPRHTEQV
ncbi:Sugar transporter family protein [Fonsecaea pedrosoi]|nr:Sugar transporter family protein [Fonsecaea pedrosoi]